MRKYLKWLDSLLYYLFFPFQSDCFDSLAFDIGFSPTLKPINAEPKKRDGRIMDQSHHPDGTETRENEKEEEEEKEPLVKVKGVSKSLCKLYSRICYFDICIMESFIIFTLFQ